MHRLNSLIGPTQIFAQPSGASTKRPVEISAGTRKKIADFYAEDYRMIREIERPIVLRFLRRVLGRT